MIDAAREQRRLNRLYLKQSLELWDSWQRSVTFPGVPNQWRQRRFCSKSVIPCYSSSSRTNWSPLQDIPLQSSCGRATLAHRPKAAHGRHLAAATPNAEAVLLFEFSTGFPGI